MSTAWPLPLPESSDPHPPRKLTLHQQQVIDSIANTYGQGSAADHTAARQMPLPAAQTPDPRRAPITADRDFRRIDWSLVLEESDLDPSDFDCPEGEVPAPDWPDPSWPGFRPGTCAYVIAVSPLFLERYPDKAWDVAHLLRRPGQGLHHDPEPDPEAEP